MVKTISGICKKIIRQGNHNGGAEFIMLSPDIPPLVTKTGKEKEKWLDEETGQNIDLYSVHVDASNTKVPPLSKGTSLIITGEYMMRDKGFVFEAAGTALGSNSKAVTFLYLKPLCKKDTDHKTILDFIGKYGTDIQELLLKNKDARQILSKELGISDVKITEMTSEAVIHAEEKRLLEELSAYNVPYHAVKRAVAKYGGNTVQKLHEDPYLTGEEIGLSFPACDLIAKDKGFGLYSEKRIKAIARETVRKMEKSGHIYLPCSDFLKLFRSVENQSIKTGKSFDTRLNVPFCLPLILSEAGEEKRQITTPAGLKTVEIFFSKSMYYAEQRIFRNIRRLNADRGRPSDENRIRQLIEDAEHKFLIKYDDTQKDAIITALKNGGVKIITGGPGTGKTTILKGILYVFEEMNPGKRIRLCAPTGRASARMREQSGHDAGTMHQLLEYKPFEGTGSHKDSSDPIDADLIVVDEGSMIDVKVFDMFLDAVKSGTRLIILGDTDQLEPVGAGAILNDILKGPKETVERKALSTIFRQKKGSVIIDNAVKIRTGDTSLITAGEFRIIRTETSQEAAIEAIALYEKYKDRENIFAAQLLCPSRKESAGTFALNRNIQEAERALREKKAQTEGDSSKQTFVSDGRVRFYAGDKILMTRNNHQAGYSNGDIGIVTYSKDNSVKALFPEGEITLSPAEMRDTDLAYAVTIHKSQGSEFDTVIVVLSDDYPFMLRPNLLYTAVTRAKERVVIISVKDALEKAITGTPLKRKTLLSDYLVTGNSGKGIRGLIKKGEH